MVINGNVLSKEDYGRYAYIFEGRLKNIAWSARDTEESHGNDGASGAGRGYGGY